MLGLGIVCVRVRECVWWFCAGNCGIPSMLLPLTPWKPISQMSRSRSHRRSICDHSKIIRQMRNEAVTAQSTICNFCFSIQLPLWYYFFVFCGDCACLYCAWVWLQAVASASMQKETNVPKTLFAVKIKTVMRGEHNELCNESNREWNLSAFAVGQQQTNLLHVKRIRYTYKYTNALSIYVFAGMPRFGPSTFLQPCCGWRRHSISLYTDSKHSRSLVYVPLTRRYTHSANH